MKLAALAAAIVVLTGCTRTIEATPQPEPPPKLDCNIIFPGPSPRA